LKHFRSIGLLLLVVAAAVTWWWLDGLEPRAGWLQVEAPRSARVGQSFPIRVDLAPQAEPGFLCADLHWFHTHDNSQGYLESGGAKPVRREGGTYDFSVMVRPKTGLGFVQVVLFLSRTGSWDTQTRVAASELIPVLTNNLAELDMQFARLRMAPVDAVSNAHPSPAAAPRLLIGLFFLAATGVAWRVNRSKSSSSEAADVTVLWWRRTMLALALAGLWELTGAQNWLDTHLRAVARMEDFYYLRGLAQKAAISTLIPSVGFLLLWFLRVRVYQRLFVSVFVLYVALSVVDLVSLHAIDQVADRSWHGITVIQALKLGCAVLLLERVFVAWTAKTEP